MRGARHAGPNGHVWIDKETFLLLRAEQHQPQERVGQELVTYTVSSVEYNAAIADAVYTYVPPAESTRLGSLSDLKTALGEILHP